MFDRGQIKQGSSIPDLVCSLVLATVFVSCCPTLGFSQTDYVLLVQQTPVDGGEVAPSLGLHSFGVDEVVAITAKPAPGYQFMYWLGDVSEPGSITTTVVLDGPKIIVAVFERTEYDLALDVDLPPRASLSRGGLGRPVGNFRMGRGGGGMRFRPRPEPPQLVTRQVEITEEPIPEDEFPVPVPEPTTLALFSVMALVTFLSKTKSIRQAIRNT